MTLDEKLDWIAKSIFILRPDMTEAAIREYHRIFSKPKPKQEEHKLKGLFLE